MQLMAGFAHITQGSREANAFLSQFQTRISLKDMGGSWPETGREATWNLFFVEFFLHFPSERVPRHPNNASAGSLARLS